MGWGLLSLLLALIWFTNLSMLGFPDGYITPYDTATLKLQEVLTWLVVAQAVYFLFLGVFGKKLRPESLLLQIVVVVALIFAPIWIVESCPGWSTCTQAYQAVTGNFMDDGSGG